MTERSDQRTPDVDFGPVRTDEGGHTSIVEFDTPDGYGRIAVERTDDGEPDTIVRQVKSDDGELKTVERIAEVSVFFSRELSWADLYENSDGALHATLNTDGGSLNNPGPAGIGFVLTGVEDTPITDHEYVGEITNNEAEYRALVEGLYRARAEGVTHITICTDSQLMARQLTGEYNVNASNLKPLFNEATALLNEFDSYEINHVPREQNTLADSLVSDALRDAGYNP